VPWRYHVAALTICIQNQCDIGCAIWIVFQPFDLGGDTIFVALEIYNAIALLVPATNMSLGDTTFVIAPAGLAKRLNQWLVRTLTTLTWNRRPADVGFDLTNAIVTYYC